MEAAWQLGESVTDDIQTDTGSAQQANADDEVGFRGEYGYQTDPQTGLVLAGHRYCSPFTRRWMNRDPIGYQGGMNLYEYAGDDPVNEVDRSGFQEEDDDEGAAEEEMAAFVKAVVDGGEEVYNKVKEEMNARRPAPKRAGPPPPSQADGSGPAKSGQYSDVPDPKNGAEPGADFTRRQKRAFINANGARNGGQLRDDGTGEPLVPAQRSVKGVTPPPNEAQVDHMAPKNPADPRAEPGTNGSGNAQVIARWRNIKKSNLP